MIKSSTHTSSYKKCIPILLTMDFPSGLDNKEYTCNAGDPRFLSGLGRSPGEGSGKPFQYSCLQNSMDRATQQATVHGVTKSRTQLSMHAQREEIDENCLFTEKTGLFGGNIIPFLGLT